MPKLSWRTLLAQVRLIHLVSVVMLLAVLIFLVASYSIRRNRAALLEVMSRQGEAMIEALVLSGENVVAWQGALEQNLSDNLGDLASVLDLWHNSGGLTTLRLTQIASASGYAHLDVVDQKGRILVTSAPTIDQKAYRDSSGNLLSKLSETLAQRLPKTLLKLAPSPFLPEGGYLYVYKSSFQSVYFLILISAHLLDDIQKDIGIGYLVQRMGQEAGIEYLAMQAPEGIVFASKNIEELYRIETDPFLQEALKEKGTRSRLARFQGNEILEVVKPFQSGQYPEGLFRMGLSLDTYRKTVAAFTKQTILVSLAIFALGLVLAGMIIVNQNVSSLKETLQKTESLTKNVLESMNSAVLAVDSSGRIIAFNRVAENIFSLSGEQVIGQDYRKVFPADQWMIEEVLKKGTKVIDVEKTYRSASSGEKNLWVNSSGIFDQQGKLIGATSVIADITQLKRLEEESKRKERLSALGNLAAGVAHEVRNPLNAISIAAQRLKAEFSPQKGQAEYEGFLNSVSSEIKRLDQIVNQFLSLARSQRLNLEPTDSTQLLEEILTLVKMEAEANGIKLVKDFTAKTNLNLDRAEMKKALLNIIQNGMQAIDRGGTLTVRTALGGGTGEFQIIVKDTGPGIQPENLPKVFQPYFTTKDKGSGLGLAITHRIIIDHQGRVEVESEMGKGTSFLITLPVVKGNS